MILLDGAHLTLEDVAAVADGGDVEVAPAGRERVEKAAAAVARVALTREVYGRTTGVGANRDRPLPPTQVIRAAGRDQRPGLGLLRSHAGGWGTTYDERVVRAGLVVRVNQLLVGASGASTGLVDALVGLLAEESGGQAVVHSVGAVGTGDLTALAEVGLTLLGERPRADGQVRATPNLARLSRLHDHDALPLMSSNAFTLGRAALGCLELERLSRRAMTVYALSHVALAGNVEALGAVVGRVTPFVGAARTAQTVTGLLGPDPVVPATQLQDFFGLRTYPQVHGPLLDQLAVLRSVVETLANAGSENPAVDATTDPPTVAHHGGFHTAYLTLAVDATLLALARSAASGLPRISHLLTDPGAGLPRFLAGVDAGASGLLIAEYAAAAGVERLRGVAAAPSSLGTAYLSAAVEDDASHSSAAAGRLTAVADDYRHLLAWELLTAVHAVRLRRVTLRGPLRQVLDACEGIVVDESDHDPGPDLTAALTVVDGLDEPA
ncbi:aromatic amino acid ammonia-lyase [Dermatophilaceae bacterium Soc4.6]